MRRVIRKGDIFNSYEHLIEVLKFTESVTNSKLKHRSSHKFIPKEVDPELLKDIFKLSFMISSDETSRIITIEHHLGKFVYNYTIMFFFFKEKNI